MSRRISSNMVTHGFFNAANDLLVHAGTADQAAGIAWTVVIILAAALALVISWEQFGPKKRGQAA